MEKGLTRQRIIAELTRSPHGNLAEYVPIGKAAVVQDADFLAHLIAWNHIHGQIRDAKVALPVIALDASAPEYRDNALAHLALLDPRNLVRAIRFAKETKAVGQRAVARMAERYLRARESNFGWWERTALQHRESLKALYALNHVKPAAFADRILFKGVTEGSLMGVVRQLRTMSPLEAAGTIMKHHIPFLVAQGAMGARMKETDVLMALIEVMSPQELVNNSKMLTKMGVFAVPALRGAYDIKLAQAAQSKKVSSLKISRAAEAIEDAKVKAKLEGAQEKQLDSLGGIEGNWLVLGDKSGSMAVAIEVARQVAAVLARMVKGEVHLVFFDTTPRYMNVTGKTFEEITQLTKGVTANGGTSIGCGVTYALDNALEVNGIAVVSDSEENTNPMFRDAYKRLCETTGNDIPVYLYWVGSNTDGVNVMGYNMEQAGQDLQVFDLREGVDYYSLPNLVQTMNTKRYGLIDAIYATPLKTLDEVFRKEEVKNVA